MEVRKLIRFNFGSSADYRTFCIELNGMVLLVELLENITVQYLVVFVSYQFAKWNF